MHNFSIISYQEKLVTNDTERDIINIIQESNIPLSGNNIKSYFNNLGDEILGFSVNNKFVNENNYVLYVTKDGLFNIKGEKIVINEITVEIIFAEFSGDGFYLFIMTSSKACYFINLANINMSNSIDYQSKIKKLDQNLRVVKIRDDNSVVAVLSDKGLSTFDVKSKEAVKLSKPNKFELNDIAWNPLGTWLIGVARNEVLFYEKNSKPRNDIQFYDNGETGFNNTEYEKFLYQMKVELTISGLQGNDFTIAYISHSDDNDIFSVLDMSGNVYLFYQKNRRWYQKSVIKVNNIKMDSNPMFWAKGKLDLYITLEDRIVIFSFSMILNSSSTDIFVIDGNRLFVSNWGVRMKPPPLYDVLIDFDSQIESLAVSEKGIAVFTMSSLFMVNCTDYQLQKAKYPGLKLDGSNYFVKNLTDVPELDNIVMGSIFIDDLYFHSMNKMYIFRDGQFTHHQTHDGFVSFVTTQLPPMICRCFEINSKKIDNIRQVVSIDDYSFIHTDSRDLYEINNKKQTVENIYPNVFSFMYHNHLLCFVHNSKKIVFKFDGKSVEHGIESNSYPVFFNPSLFSVIILMPRGNIEAQSKHIVVLSKLVELISNNQLEEALYVSKRYMVHFDRIVDLFSDEKIKCLITSGIPDIEIRSFISFLKPSESNDHQLFLYRLLSAIFEVEITTLNQGLPANTTFAHTYYSVVCIILILLDNPVLAVDFACNLTDSSISYDALKFLLTIFDSNKLYDLSLKTYNMRNIATVSHVIMKEPSVYLNDLKRLKSLANDDLRKAIIDDEYVQDYKSAIYNYSKSGEEYFDRIRELAIENNLFDDALRALENAPNDVRDKLVEEMLKSFDKKDSRKIASTVIKIRKIESIKQYINHVVDANLYYDAFDILPKDDYPVIIKALVDSKKYEKAAFCYEKYLNDLKNAATYYIKARKWKEAIRVGADKTTTIKQAYKIYSEEFTNFTTKAQKLKESFKEVLEKQKVHPEAGVRKGKKKDNRGLPSIISKLLEMLPDDEKFSDINYVVEQLHIINEEELEKDLSNKRNKLIRAIWPIPSLPETEQMLVPVYLRGIL